MFAAALIDELRKVAGWGGGFSRHIEQLVSPNAPSDDVRAVRSMVATGARQQRKSNIRIARSNYLEGKNEPIAPRPPAEYRGAIWDQMVRQARDFHGKTASFRSRFSTSLVRDVPGEHGFPAQRVYAMTGPGGYVGQIQLRKPANSANWSVNLTHIAPKFRGFHLGRKLYGDVMREVGSISSDRLVSDAASRVWHSMAKSPNYRVTESPSRPVTSHLLGYASDMTGREAVGHSSIFTGRLVRRNQSE